MEQLRFRSSSLSQHLHYERAGGTGWGALHSQRMFRVTLHPAPPEFVDAIEKSWIERTQYDVFASGVVDISSPVIGTTATLSNHTISETIVVQPCLVN
ncbi:MAG: hypothetical protein ABEH59_02895 [Halobacteriales archaeon]